MHTSEIIAGVYHRMIAKRVATGAAWMVSFRFVSRLIGVASLPILARLLLPDDVQCQRDCATFFRQMSAQNPLWDAPAYTESN